MYELTKYEQMLFDLLSEYMGEVVSYERLSYFLWEKDKPKHSNRLIKLYVSRLRKKVEPNYYIMNFTNWGYSLSQSKRDEKEKER